MLAIAWFGLMALASSTLVVATMVVQQRAFLQHSADVVTLAFAQRGETDAQRLAAFAGASIVKSEYSASQVTVMIRNRYGSSQASAHRLVEAFDQ